MLLYLVEPESSRTFCCKVYKRIGEVFKWFFPKSVLERIILQVRAQNNGRSTDNVRTDWGFDRSNFRLAGHVDRSKFNSVENKINLSFLLFSCFSCYLSSRCVLRNFDMKSW